MNYNVNKQKFAASKQQNEVDAALVSSNTAREILEIRSQKHIFPLDVFPSYIHDFCSELSKKLGSSSSAIGAGVLSAVASCMGNSVKYKVEAHTNRPALWIVLLGASSVGKTETLDACFAPFLEMSDLLTEQYNKDMMAYKEGNLDFKPKKPTLLSDDFYIQTLKRRILPDNSSFTARCDESRIWFERLQTPKEDTTPHWLEAWKGRRFEIMRSGKEDAETQTVKNFTLNFIGGIQPIYVDYLFCNNANNNPNYGRVSDGFMSRLLPFWDVSIREYNERTKERFFEKKEPVNLRLWRNVLNHIFHLREKGEQDIFIDDKALEAYKNYCWDIEEKYNKPYMERHNGIQPKTPTKEYVMDTYVSKIREQFSRIAMTLYVLEQACESLERVQDGSYPTETIREEALQNLASKPCPLWGKVGIDTVHRTAQIMDYILNSLELAWERFEYNRQFEGVPKIAKRLSELRNKGWKYDRILRTLRNEDIWHGRGQSERTYHSLVGNYKDLYPELFPDKRKKV